MEGPIALASDVMVCSGEYYARLNPFATAGFGARELGNVHRHQCGELGELTDEAKIISIPR
jgi:hypothetical protein